MVTSVTPRELSRRLAQKVDPPPLLLDVRESDERATAVITPSVHIPMEEITRRKDELPRDREIVVFCHTGFRSAMVAGYLEGEGFPHMVNLTGGIDAWSRTVDPSVPRY